MNSRGDIKKTVKVTKLNAVLGIIKRIGTMDIEEENRLSEVNAVPKVDEIR